MDPGHRRIRPFRGGIVAPSRNRTANRAGAERDVLPPQTVATRTAVDQAAPRASAPQLITFDEYREFRLNNIAERRARLTRALAATDLSATEKASLEGRKAYYDRLAAMPADQRDRQFRDRFDQIDTNHDGMIDNTERTAWREKHASIITNWSPITPQPMHNRANLAGTGDHSLSLSDKADLGCRQCRVAGKFWPGAEAAC